jgi:D-glycero-D-manno-heptose 1,7-bisphosphate phosphatase
MTMARPVAFLDRDGVINIDTGYVWREEALAFTPGAPAGIRLFNEAGYRVIVVTNQSGVARGLYTLDDVDRFHAAMRARLAGRGAHIDAFYVAPWHEDGIVPAFSVAHEDRKPGPGMLLRAMRDFPTIMAGSVVIGDKASDIEAGAAAGLPGIRVPANVCDLAAVARDWLARQAPLVPDGAERGT